MNSHRKMTPKGQMSSSGMGPAITVLPPHLKAMFEPNAPLQHLPQLTKRKMPPYSGVASFLDQFESTVPPERKIEETPKERRERVAKERLAQQEAAMQAGIAQWDPQKLDEKKTEDAYKTLFVGRISYETTAQQLRQEFEQYGPIRKLRLVEDAEGKSRGYAFIEYEKEGDLKVAYKQADGKKIDGRRVVVDVERGRTVRDWKPRKFGGGIGETRKGGADVNVKYSGREPITQVKVGGMREARSDRNGDDRYGPRGGRERSRSRSRNRGPPPSSRDRRDRHRSKSRSRSRSRGRDRERERGRGDRDRYYDSRDYHRDRGGRRDR